MPPRDRLDNNRRIDLVVFHCSYRTRRIADGDWRIIVSGQTGLDYEIIEGLMRGLMQAMGERSPASCLRPYGSSSVSQ